MSVYFYLFSVMSVALLALAILFFIQRRRFQKLTPPTHYAKVEMQPGKTRLDFTRDGVVVASLVLLNVTRDMTGTSAQFEDYSRYLRDRTFPFGAG